MEDIVDLIVKVRSGDNLAFEKLCEIYTPLINSMSRSFASTSPEANMDDDYLQESKMAFYSAIMSFDTAQDGVTFGLYAKNCIRNRLITFSRKAKSKKRRQLKAEMSETQDSTQDKVVRDALKKEFLSLAEDLLSDYEMKIFKMYISGLRAKEISAKMGKSEKSVNNAIFRIRSKIKKKIKGDT